MKLTAEISMYPLHDEYLEPIQWFIKRLDSYANIERTPMPWLLRCAVIMPR